MASTAPALDTLDLDIVLIVFEYLAATSPESARCLAATNRHLQAAGKTGLTALYRDTTLSLEFQEPDVVASNLAALARHIDDDRLLRGARTLTIRSRWQRSAKVPSASVDDTWKQVTTLIRRLRNLRWLVWDHRCHIRATILDALVQAQPSAKLKISRWERDDFLGDHKDANEIALSWCPVLVAIHARVVVHVALHEVNSTWRAALYRIIANAPHLQHVSIANNVRDPHHEIDPIHEIEFLPRKVPNTSVRSLTLDSFYMSAATLEYWSSIVDLNRLERLKCCSGPLYLSFFDRAPRTLKDLSLNLGGKYEGATRGQMLAAVNKYLLECAPLQSLSLWSWEDLDLPAVLRHHGPKLERLGLHEKIFPDERHELSIVELHQIKDHCPQLHELTIDVGRTDSSFPHGGDWTAGGFDALVAMRLTKLVLCYEPRGIEALIPDSLPQPNESETTKSRALHKFVRDLWQAIYGEVGHGERALDVKIGEWESRHHVWSGQEKTLWRVRPGDRIGEIAVDHERRLGGDC